MFSEESLSKLQESCSAVAHDNWDGSVEVTQDETGTLHFILFNEDGETDSSFTAAPWGQTLDGRDLWNFIEEGGHNSGAVMTLVPVAIVGVMGL
jgi:hypothetical protein